MALDREEWKWRDRDGGGGMERDRTDVSTGVGRERGERLEGMGYRERTEKLNLGINHAISISLPTFLAAAPDISEIHPVTRQ